ncbi:MAG: hypothetical protein JSW41_03825 [Candidatus Aenigmatarchaeota archaeon]|nr:MAG: hypothetical protein JSW41_03825 [Candidatus Aenigmarchaeota archaeon]
MAEDLIVDLKDVDTEDLIIVAHTWGTMQELAMDDMKASGMLGFVQPYLPEFLKWLLSQKTFKSIAKMPLENFVKSMLNVIDLKPEACFYLVIKLKEDQEKGENHDEEKEGKEEGS